MHTTDIITLPFEYGDLQFRVELPDNVQDYRHEIIRNLTSNFHKAAIVAINFLNGMSGEDQAPSDDTPWSAFKVGLEDHEITVWARVKSVKASDEDALNTLVISTLASGLAGELMSISLRSKHIELGLPPARSSVGILLIGDTSALAMFGGGSFLDDDGLVPKNSDEVSVAG